MTYSNTPQANQQIAATQPLIQGNFAFLSTAINKEHNFNAADATATYHKQASMPNMADPTNPPAGTDGMYYVNGSHAKFITSGGTICQLTLGNPIDLGYQWISRALVQWGFVSIASTGTGTQAFPIAFPNNCWSFQATPYYNSTTPSSGAEVAILSNVTEPQKTQFTYYFTTNSNAYNGFYWIAIGN